MVHRRSLNILAAVAFILIFSMASVQAGQPNKPGKPGLTECLAEVNQLQQTIATQEATIGALQEQIATLNASLKYTLPKTGQTCLTYEWAPGCDGELQKGMAWPDPRFFDNGDGTVTDNMTDLVWTKNPNIFGSRSWYQALIDCDNYTGDWRLPNRNELMSLVDIEYKDGYYGALPPGHPFITPTEGYYWTSSMASYNFGSYAWAVRMVPDGDVIQDGQNASHYVWCVRDPQ